MESLSNIEQINTSLAGYKGWSAMLWFYNPTHRRIIVRIYKVDHENDNDIEEIFVLCAGCLSYSGPIDWCVDWLKITISPYTLNGEPLSQLTDNVAGFKLTCDNGISLHSIQPNY